MVGTSGLITQGQGGELVTGNSAAFKSMGAWRRRARPGVRRDRPAADMTRTVYAAATRAWSLLVVVGDPNELRAVGMYTRAAMFRSPKDDAS